MKKLQLNKLSLKNLTTPLLALSLIAGCVGIFGGSAFAASTSFLATPRPVTPPITSVQQLKTILGTSLRIRAVCRAIILHLLAIKRR